MRDLRQGARYVNSHGVKRVMRFPKPKPAPAPFKVQELPRLDVWVGVRGKRIDPQHHRNSPLFTMHRQINQPAYYPEWDMNRNLTERAFESALGLRA